MRWARETARRLGTLATPRPERLRSGRGAAELSVVVVTASLVGGVLFGNGLTRTAVDIADGLTWVGDGPTGEVIQVNPATGRPEVRIEVGADGDDIAISQWDGRMIVTNRSTGELTSWDLAEILASGQRRVATGGASEVLEHQGDVFVVDRDRGTVAAIDPVSTDPIGEMWTAGRGLADAAVDERGHLWAIDDAGLLRELRWSPGTAGGTFVVEDERPVEDAAARTVLVGHEQGVTVFGADAGIVVQVGTGHDVVADADQLSGELAAPDQAPSDLVPVSSPETGTVAIVDGARVVEVAVGAIGCTRPAGPEVFQSTVFVPCPGDGKVVRLRPDGTRAGADIVLPEGGDPDLVLDDNQLVVNVPGAATGAVVHADGSVDSIIRYADDVPAVSGDELGVSDLLPEAAAIAQAAQADLAPDPPVVPQPPAPEDDGPADKPGKGEQDEDPGKPGTGSGDGSGSGANAGDGAGQDDDRPGTVCVLGAVCVAPGNGQDADDQDGTTPGTGGTPADGSGEGTGQGTGGGNPEPPQNVEPALGNGNGNGNGTGGTGEPGGSTTPPPPPPPPSGNRPLAAPTSVQAVALPTGEVQVQWAHEGTPATSFQVEKVGGDILTTVGSDQRTATVSVPPGPHTFTVTALRANHPARTSAPSNEVTTTGEPGPVSTVLGEAVGNKNDNRAQVSIRWDPAADNGSPVLHYDVIIQDAFRTQSIRQVATSFQYVAECAETYCDPGPITVSITAANVHGPGPTTTTRLAYEGTTPPPLPAGGQQLVQSQVTEWAGNGTSFGKTRLTLAAPADWASFQGTCTWTHRGNDGPDETREVACSETVLEVFVTHSPPRPQDSRDRQHSIVFTASTTRGAEVRSAQYDWTVTIPG